MESDFSHIDDPDAEKDAAFPAFKRAMKGRLYGYEAINDAWEWFKEGWHAESEESE